MDETVSHTTLTLHIACLLCLIPAAHPHISNTLPHSRLTLSTHSAAGQLLPLGTYMPVSLLLLSLLTRLRSCPCCL